MAFDTDCWEWTGTRTAAGYGQAYFEGVRGYVHRWVTDAPKGMVVDHLCKNHACYNPRHLEVVTDYENRARGNSPAATAMRTNFCVQGHEYTDENTYWVPSGRGRACKACRRIRANKSRDERRANV